MRLLATSPAQCRGIAGYGLEIAERVPLHTPPTQQTLGDPLATQRRLGHSLGAGHEQPLHRRSGLRVAPGTQKL